MDAKKITKDQLDAVKNNLEYSNYASVEDFLKAFENDDGDAFYALSVAMQVECMDEHEWAKYLELAAQYGSMGAMEQLADFLYDEEIGQGLFVHNEKKAIELYKTLAEYDNLRALYVLGVYYLSEDSEEYNPQLGIKYLEKVGDTDVSLCDYVAQNFAILGDYEKAIYYYKKAQWVDEDGEPIEELDDEGIFPAFYPQIAYSYYKLNDISNALKYANKGIVSYDDKHCYFLEGLICFDEENYQKAYEFFLKAASNNSPDACYYLGMLLKDDSYGMEDKNKAYYYYKKAKELGYDCDYSINTLEVSKNGSKSDSYIDYISNLVDENIPVYKYPSIVENDLKNDFGQYWNCLSDFTKNVFITGITSLIVFVSCEKNNRQTSLDYSSVIISISRGLERELKDIFYCKFRDYLLRESIDPNYYKRLTNFTFMDGDNLTYTKSDFWFTLGKMKIIVNEHLSTNRYGDKYTNIDYYLRDFCDVIFKKNAFSSDSHSRKIDITKYMCELAKQVDDIANNFRNEAAHTNSISSLDKARVCVDWIIKVKKLLLKLIEKIDYKKLNSI